MIFMQCFVFNNHFVVVFKLKNSTISYSHFRGTNRIKQKKHFFFFLPKLLGYKKNVISIETPKVQCECLKNLITIKYLIPMLIL